MTFQEALREAGGEILDKIAMRSLSNYFTQGDANSKAVPNIVTSRTGKLALAVLNAAEKRDIRIDSDKVVIGIGIDRGAVPYATLIHEGGIRAVTPKMRSFFWAKWHQTGDVMWRALTRRTNIVYKPRPFLARAIADMRNEIPEILKSHSIEFLRMEIRKIITF